MSAFRTKNVFVNPFYQEGVGRRTGIVLNKKVRKDSGGFEVFDDYWSESESENDITINRTHTNAAEKENHGTKPRLKKSSLKSMPSFSPAVTSSEREESKAEPLPQEVSHAAENASALEADLTGSIIKVPPSSLEPSSALCKFKTRQRLSFSAAASSEESQTTEGEGSVGDEGESQESGTSSEGTVKAPSSQSELSQEEGDSPTETETEDGETGSEMQSSQATGETSQEEGDVPNKAGAPSLSQDGEAQRRESKRRSTRGKPAQANLQDESTRPDSDQDAIAAKERRSRKSSSRSKDVTGNVELCEKEGEEKIGVETRHRKSTCQSHKVTNDDEGDEMQKDTGKERKSTQQLNVSIPNENYPEKDNEKKADDTRRRKSTRRSNKVEKKEEEEKENEKENVKTRRSIRHANIVENARDNVGKEKEDAKSTRRKSEKHSNAPVGKEIEEKEDECKDDKVAKGEGEVGGDKRDEVQDPATETGEEAGETETGEMEETGETETEGAEVVEPVKEKTNVEAEYEVKIKDAVTRKKEILTVSKPDVGEDDDDDTERVFFSLRTSTAVPSDSNLEDEFDVVDANPQEFGVMDDAMNKKHKKVERTSGHAVSKGGRKGRKKNNIKESQVDDKSEHLKRSTRKPTKGKQESKKPKGQKDRAMKRGSNIHRDDDQKKSKESPEEATNGFKDRSKPNSGNKKSRGKKSNKQNDRLERSRSTSGSTSQASSSDTDTGSQPEDTMLDHKTKQRKQGRKKASDHPAELSKTGKKSEKTASGKTQEKDENGQSGGKPGSSNQVMKSHRSRRSSVHFTTKDMISVSGDISVHQVSSGEDDNANKRKAPPTPAALPVDKRNSKKSSKRKSSGSRAKTQDKTADDDIENEVEHLSGQSESDSTAESEKENADQGRSRRGRNKGSKAKKRRSSLAVSTTSVIGAEEASGGKKRRVNRREQERAKSASESDGDASEGNVGHQESHHNETCARSPGDDMSNESTTASSKDQQEISSFRSLSTGSILKVSQEGGTRRQNKKKKYSILFTEKPLQKAYIIKPDEEDGVRRTRRQRVRPLEYWRNERPLYERRKSGGFALAGILSPEQPEKKEFSRSVRAPAKPKDHLPVTPSNISIHTTPPVGVSKVCQPTVNVVNPDSEQEVAIDAVARSKMLMFTGPSGLPAEPDDPITISKALSQKAFSAGVLTVRPFEEKGSQMVRRDTMVFYVVRGKIAMTLHETSQILQSGDFFFVPKGNVYNIKNLRKDEAKLTFFQLKSV